MPLTKFVINLLTESVIAPNTTSPFSVIMDLTRAVALSVTAKVVYGADSLQPCSVQLFSSVDGVNFDTFPFNTFAVPIKPGGTGGASQVTVDVPASGAYVRANVMNADLSTQVTGVRVDGVKQDAS